MFCDPILWLLFLFWPDDDETLDGWINVHGFELAGQGQPMHLQNCSFWNGLFCVGFSMIWALKHAELSDDLIWWNCLTLTCSTKWLARCLCPSSLSVSLCHCWHALVVAVVLVLVIFYSSDLSGHAPVPVLDPAALAFDETLGFMLVT
jgi:hypothetical protein